MRTVIELVEVDLAAERIAVNAEQARGARLVAVGAVQHALDELLLKFVDRFVKQNSSLHHLAHQRFQLIFHDRTLRKRGSRRSLSAESGQFVARQQPVGFPVLGLCRGDHVRGQFRPGRLLVPADAFEVVADVLLVERRLRPAGRVALGGPEARRIRRQRFVNPDQFVADQPELKLGIGQQDAARLGIGRGATVDLQADVAKLLGARGRRCAPPPRRRKCSRRGPRWPWWTA